MGKPLALVIEDDIDLNMIFSTALSAAGFEVETINDGKEALLALSAKVPALVVLDLHLPHTSGDQILGAIRADQRLADVKVILTTADHQLANSVEHQADLVLIKPISYVQLKELATRLLPE